MEAENRTTCLEACKDEPDCLWANHNSDDGSCVLLESCDLVRDCDSCRRAQAACAVNSDTGGSRTSKHIFLCI